MSEHKNFFLAPRSNETSYKNFKSTITYGIDYNKIGKILDSAGKEIIFKQNKIYAWGCTDNLKSRWDKMQPGDFVLFYVKGVFRYVGEVIFKQFNPELSDALWPRKNDKPWSCVFFLSNIKEIYIPLNIINEVCGYNFKLLQGF